MTARVLLALLVLPVSSAIADVHVWTTSLTHRVLREDTPPADIPRQVRIHLARNETRSLQLLVRSDAAVKGLSIEPGDLPGPDGAALRSSDATLYRQHQLQITRGTYRNSDFTPGWYPDALIPFAKNAGARFVATPFDLPANQTHGFWVDVHAPADAKAGEYRGTYRVTGENGKIADVEVTVRVWDFALPRVSTFQTALGSPAGRLRAYYRKRAAAGIEKQPENWTAIETQSAKMLTEHRINATPPSDTLAPRAQADGSFAIPQQQIANLRTFVDTYHVNAIQVPQPQSVIKDPEAERQKLHAWLAAFDRMAKELDRPSITFYTYLLDEPNDQKAYRLVQKWGKAIRECKSVVKVMVVEQTTTQDEAWGDLYGAVDIWCPLFPLFEPENAAKRQALGEVLWCYTALCQGKDKTPWWHTDYPLLHYRVPAWMAWRYQMKGILYWGGLSYWDKVNDPWTEPNTYRPDDAPTMVYNGEGSIVYPGWAAGYEGITPSLRLKALRDSVQDYEYLAMAGRAKPAETEKIVLTLTSSFFQWNAGPAAYDHAREKLAELILSATPPR